MQLTKSFLLMFGRHNLGFKLHLHGSITCCRRSHTTAGCAPLPFRNACSVFVANTQYYVVTHVTTVDKF